MIIGIRHFGIVVDNLKKSLDFYQNILGFELVVTADEDTAFIDSILALKSSKLKTYKLKDPHGNIVELLDFGEQTMPSDNKITSTGPTHIALTVKNIEETFNYMKSRGIHFISPPLLSSDGFAKVAFCKAPEGTYIEIVEVFK
jgi:catechol 2,3-dioxygenase-like lactoylglutathione lyase family enzyme